MRKTILTIAGSDPSGGAGIQADIKTMTSLNIYAAAVITTITCQNSMGVSCISPLAPSLVREQISSVLEDFAVSHIKIGMTGSPDIIKAITQALSRYKGEVILDPVLKSSSGTVLTDSPEALTPLIAKATVLTPNSHELSILSASTCTTVDESVRAGRKLLDHFPNLQAICLKGGHLNENDTMVTDTLLIKAHGKTIEKSLCHPRHQSSNTHGTGCTFASAFSAHHALLGDYTRAFSDTVTYIDFLIEQGKKDDLCHGTGPLMHYRQNKPWNN